MDRAAALFLALGSLAFLPGGMMFWRRGGTRGLPVPSRAYFLWERSFVMAAVILTALGFVLLEGHLQNTGGRTLARAGAAAYLFAGALVVAAEAQNLNGGYEQRYPLVVVYVVMACLAQAAIGVALLQSVLLAAWVGWLAIVWNIGWLVVVLLISRRDVYFPFAHHVAPLVIGLALLWQS